MTMPLSHCYAHCHPQSQSTLITQALTVSMDIVLEFRQGHKGGNNFHTREKLESNDYQLVQESVWSQGLRYAELEPLLMMWSDFALTVFICITTASVCLPFWLQTNGNE